MNKFDKFKFGLDILCIILNGSCAIMNFLSGGLFAAICWTICSGCWILISILNWKRGHN